MVKRQTENGKPKTENGIIMGTSTARRAPASRAWRQAKAAATRYLSPESSAPVTAREVAARYMSALEESGQEAGGALAAFARARKMAQNLGEFCQQAREQGRPKALAHWQLADLLAQSPDAAAHGLAAAWLQGILGLEEASLRPALISRLAMILSALSEPPAGCSAPEASLEVTGFLASVLYHRLVFDLGESLEAAAPGWRRFSEGLAGLKAELTQAAEAGADEAPAPADWQGLEGWLWVTRVLEGMLDHLAQKDLVSK